MKKSLSFGQTWKQMTIEFDSTEQKEQYKSENRIKEKDVESESDLFIIITKKRENEYIRISEASELTGLKETYIRTLAGKGEIPSYKQGKFLVFKPEELKQWLEDRTNKR